ncbi:MAG: hypothetical protein IJJ26_01885 [Victivallales bacterium]|nr:hypothetical protein [Victivallales bacterium]
MNTLENLFYKVRCCSAATMVQMGIRGMYERSGGSLFASTRNYSHRAWALLLEDVYVRDVDFDRCEQEAELYRIILEGLLAQLHSDGEDAWHAQSLAYQRVMATLYTPLTSVENPFHAYCDYYQKMSMLLQPWLEHPERDTVINALTVLAKHVLNAMRRKLEQEELSWLPSPVQPQVGRPLRVAELVPVCPCCKRLMERNGRAWRCRACEDFLPETIASGIAL